MERFHSLEEYRAGRFAAQPCCCALGKFDGLHRGHRKLIGRVLEKAAQSGRPAVLFAIEMKEEGILTHAERADLLRSMGMDALLECPFSRAFMELRPAQFLERILRDTLHASYVAVGTDYRFGYRRAGDAELLCAAGQLHGFAAETVEKERYAGEEISSTRVREALLAGQMELAGALLGRSYGISGTVQHGRHLGTSIGEPTANLLPPPDKFLPRDGVYASRVSLPDGSVHAGVTNIGFRPTVGGRRRTIETTLLQYSGNLYGHPITVTPVHFLREEIRFASLADLKGQIAADKKAAESFYP